MVSGSTCPFNLVDGYMNHIKIHVKLSQLSPSSFQLRGFGLPGLRLWSDVTHFADSLSGGLRGL